SGVLPMASTMPSRICMEIPGLKARRTLEENVCVVKVAERPNAKNNLFAWSGRAMEKFHEAAPAEAKSLRPHRRRDRAGLAQPGGQVDELAQQRPRVARIDDVLDQERFGGTERGVETIEPLLDLDAQRLAIRRGVEFGAVRGLDAAFDRQRA